MKIGIDARLIAETGIGRYIRNLIAGLGRFDGKNSYVVFLPQHAYDSFVLPNTRWEKRLCTIHWHTLKEQLLMPRIFAREHLDLLHVPYFNAPIFYSGAFVVTIHDLTILHVTTGKATTLPKPLYLFRKIGYQLIVRLGVLRARHVIAVSETTKNDIVKSLGTDPKKISVTYEGVDTSIVSAIGTSPQQYPYFLYVGNAYPHKNLEFLIRSFGTFVQNHPTHRLVLVGKNDFFYQRLITWVKQLAYKENIVFVNSADDALLASYYHHAISFIFPSLMEGFGLPALEAIRCNTPVICSDIPVFHELFTTIPTYIDPRDEQTLVSAMEQSVSQKKKQLTDVEKKSIARYQWENTAKETLRVYTLI